MGAAARAWLCQSVMRTQKKSVRRAQLQQTLPRPRTHFDEDFDSASLYAADAVVSLVLRCTWGEGCQRKARAAGVRNVACGHGNVGPASICCACEEGGAGEARTATSAKPPLGAIATSRGSLNCALPPSREPRPLPPASVVVTPVAMSMLRMRWPSCDAAREEGTHTEEASYRGSVCGMAGCACGFAVGTGGGGAPKRLQTCRSGRSRHPSADKIWR